MDIKETFINSVTLKMQSTLDCHDLSILQNALSGRIRTAHKRNAV